MKNKGFTLIELIVVIAIIAILAAIIAPNAFKAIEKSKVASSIEDCRSIKTAVMSFYSDCGIWPTSSASAGAAPNGIAATPTATIAGWDGPYIEKWPPLARWSGNYSYYAAADENANVGSYAWDGTAGAPQPNTRVITISTVPLAAEQKMETQLDGTASPGATQTTGGFRYSSTANVYYLISQD
ncbi:MAG: prepilin-type N-terminal cleavage/methylation domain-containing protein [Candidatus Omnitrophota bacterium]